MINNIYKPYLELHKTLNNYLNGYSFTNSSKIFYPLIDKNIIYNKKISSNKASEIISSFYRKLYEKDGKLSKFKTYKIIKNPEVKANIDIWEETVKKRIKKNKNDKIYKVYKVIQKIKKLIDKNFFINFYIHGSFSTFDYTNWSDLDLLAIIRNDVIDNKTLLRKIRKIFLDINKLLFYVDPLQHHGVFIIAEYELNLYLQSYYPVELYKYTTSFFDDNDIDIRVMDSKEIIKEELMNILDYITGFKRRNIYDVKMLYHLILLIPTLYLEAKYNKYVYKKFSFELAKKDFSSKEWSIVEEVSQIRNTFDYNPAFSKILLRISPTFWWNVLVHKILIRKKLEADFIERVKIFCDCVKKRILYE